MTRDHYKGSKKTRDAQVDSQGRLIPLEKSGAAPAVTIFNQGNTPSEVMTSRSDGLLVNAYVDQINGSDTNDGLSASTALKTLTAFQDKFPIRVYNKGALIANLINDSGSRITMLTDGLHIGGGGNAFNNSVVYRGPEMILFSPATGPSTAALDSTPAVRVGEDGLASGVGNRTRLDFTSAAPAWPVNGLRGSFLRVTRAGTRLFDEIPISSNTVDTLVVDSLNIVGTLLATDTVEVVEPAIKLQGYTGFSDGGSNTLLSFYGDSTSAIAPNAVANLVGATLTRLSFDDVWSTGVEGLQFDRCKLSLDKSGGNIFTGGSVSFKNTVCMWHLGLHCGTFAVAEGRSDDAPTDTSAKVGLILLGGKLVIGGVAPNGSVGRQGVYVSTLPVSVYDEGIEVMGPGSMFACSAAVGGTGADAGTVGIFCNYGGKAAVAGGNLTTITGPAGDLKVGTGAVISYGTGAGDFEEAAGFNGTFSRVLEGTATAPYGDTSLITTDVPTF